MFVADKILDVTVNAATAFRFLVRRRQGCLVTSGDSVNASDIWKVISTWKISQPSRSLVQRITTPTGTLSSNWLIVRSSIALLFHRGNYHIEGFSATLFW
jgi:hypothetical protein